MPLIPLLSRKGGRKRNLTANKINMNKGKIVNSASGETGEKYIVWDKKWKRFVLFLQLNEARKQKSMEVIKRFMKR